MIVLLANLNRVNDVVALIVWYLQKRVFINKKKEELQEVTYKLAAKVYEQAAKEAEENKTDNSENAEEPKKDDVKEAEFEEK